MDNKLSNYIVLLEKLTNKKVILTEELSTFLQKVKEKTINYKTNGGLEWYWLGKIDNWPVVEYGDGGYSPEEAKKKNIPLEKQTLDLENFEIIELTNDKLIVYGGGDWQYPFVVTIKLVNGKLRVTDCEPYSKKWKSKNIKTKDIYKIFQAEDILPIQENIKAKDDAIRLINQSFNKEYWNDIKKVWKLLDNKGYEGPEHDKYLNELVENILNDDDLYYSSKKPSVKEYLEKEIGSKLDV